MHSLLLLYSWFIYLVTFFWPDIPFIMRLRGKLYSIGMNRSGNNFMVASGARLRSLENITVGNDVYIANDVIINAGGYVLLDDQVMIGFKTCIIGGNHSLLENSYRFGPSLTKPIHIGFGSWIGCNCSILAGSIIPKTTVIGAGSTVTKSLETPGIYYGTKLRRA
ncbi:acyltransferase [Vibrio breoganii]